MIWNYGFAPQFLMESTEQWAEIILALSGALIDESIWITKSADFSWKTDTLWIYVHL